MKAVERVFNNLSKETSAFQKKSGLSCYAGCGKCCFKPDITATILEFLPLAYSLCKEKRAFEWLEIIKSNENGYCPLFKSLVLTGEKGYCSEYKYRGLICRLFGFSAALDKNGNQQLVTCKSIKSGQPEIFNLAQKDLAAGGKVPLMRNYYFQLSAIDPELNMRFYPIKEAIKRAIEIVLSYYAYRRRSA